MIPLLKFAPTVAIWWLICVGQGVSIVRFVLLYIKWIITLDYMLSYPPVRISTWKRHRSMLGGVDRRIATTVEREKASRNGYSRYVKCYIQSTIYKFVSFWWVQKNGTRRENWFKRCIVVGACAFLGSLAMHFREVVIMPFIASAVARGGIGDGRPLVPTRARVIMVMIIECSSWAVI